MTKFLGQIKTKLKRRYTLGLACVVAIGTLTSAVVFAVIPDTSSVFHGCYKTNGGSLRVIDDASQTCATNETAITWNQTGPQGPVGPTGPQGPAGSDGDQVAYATVLGPTAGQNPYKTPQSLTLLRSKNVAEAYYSVQFADGTTDVDSTYICLKMSFVPKFVFSSQSAGPTSLIRGESASGDTKIDSFCGSSYVVAVQTFDGNGVDFIAY
jgi:hypothetical protein